MITPCEAWATEADLCSPCLEDYSADMGPYLQQASELLYQLSAQQFPGTCTVTVKPCANYSDGHPTVFEPAMSAPLTRHLHPNQPFPWSACNCGGTAICSCSRKSAVILPHLDVIEVTEVTLETGVMDPADYTLEDNRLLRLDDENWPCCDDDFTITYTHGIPVPASGVRAAAVLACELLLACEPDAIPGAKCRLPRNITSISRQGISVIFDRLTNSGPFRFGIWEVDVFLEAFNPYGLSGPSYVMSPDTMNQAHRVP